MRAVRTLTHTGQTKHKCYATGGSTNVMQPEEAYCRRWVPAGRQIPHSMKSGECQPDGKYLTQSSLGVKAAAAEVASAAHLHRFLILRRSSAS